MATVVRPCRLTCLSTCSALGRNRFLNKVDRYRTRTWVARQQYSSAASLPIIAIENATFYDQYPSPSDEPNARPAIFKDVDFTLRASQNADHPRSDQQWAIVSRSSIARTSFLQVLAGQHIVQPPTARKYPALAYASMAPHDAIKYVGFDADRGNKIGGTSLRGAYLSARYESRREKTDFSVRDYLIGHTELNGLEKEQSATDKALLNDVVARLNLGPLIDMPVSNLSNGQTRRARIAKALMDKPQLLLLDGPFMGLDPRAVKSVSEVLKSLSASGEPQLVVSLRPEDLVPEWTSHLIVVDSQRQILAQGEKEAVYSDQQSEVQLILAETSSVKDKSTMECEAQTKPNPAQVELGEPIVEMQGVKVTYGDKISLGDWETEVNGDKREGLWWTLRRGQRCGIFGPNGSGKTTLLSLITSDHPQAYGLPIKTFGRSRLPTPGEPGISLFELQRRMGHSSPEVHAFFPRHLTVRRSLESAWADAPLAKPALNASHNATVDDFLRTFAAELYNESSEEADWTTQVRFGELSFPSQRLLLFLRAIIAQPELIILDEAFSGLDDKVRRKAFQFLAQGHAGVDAVVQPSSVTNGTTRSGAFNGLTNDQALLVVSHSKQDVPECVLDWICLPEPGYGQPPRTGVLKEPLVSNPAGWDQIWDT